MGTDDTLVSVLTSGASGIEVPLTAEEITGLRYFAGALREKNKVMNLTGITDDEGIAMRHFVDSLTIVRYIREEQQKAGKEDLTLIDVGTGAGFPGIPVKIAIPELQVTLMDSLQKRLNFLEEVTDALSMKDIRTLHSRAEDAGRNKRYREQYDIATARAVADLPVLCEYCLPFVKVGGIFLAMKGRSEDETKRSAKAVATLGGTIEKCDSFCLPGTDMERSVIVIRKLRHTPPAYPRQAGKPSRSPIV
ncbi:MAG: 16S rRNA (guanine(527)-N(7))-methyltransferase RsmG [Clostridiales bacterium]|nr:16S rRNA (guanine(527)-N(7))-methyltransferase RsmG [Clostridiales bacterium]